MRRIGFSTGALAKGDFRRGLELQADRCDAVELSALREDEMDALIDALPNLNLKPFGFVSFHAPSKLEKSLEASLVKKLEKIKKDIHGIVVHPDIIQDTSLWQSLGNKVILENMDQRKPIGRTVKELLPYFEKLPEARFCLDLGHAQQVDPTQSLTLELLKAFATRLAEIHISEVDITSKHVPISRATSSIYRRIASLIPSETPVIIESVIEPHDIEGELSIVKDSLSAKPIRVFVGV